MFTLPKSDPLDVLVYGIGLRLTQLAKMGDPKFKKLLENRTFTIQMGTEAQDVYRHFKVDNGRFTQAEGKAVNPSLTIDFKDSMTGAKLLTKGDATAFMSGIQNGDVKMSGDYSLLMWFNQVAKHIVPKVPEQLQPAVEMAKPLLTKATPIAKDLCDKAMSLLTSFGILGSTSSKASDKSAPSNNEKATGIDENKSKYFSEKSDEKAVTKDEEKSLIDTAKEKLAEVKADVEEKVGELKEKFDDVKVKATELTTQATEKLDEVKADAETKVTNVKDKAEDLTTQAKDKLDEVRADAETKVDDVKDKAEDLTTQATEKLDEVKTEAETKLTDAKDKAEDLTTQTKEKVTEVKDMASEKVDAVKEKADDLGAQAKDKLENVKTDAETKISDVKGKAEDFTNQVKDKTDMVANDAKTDTTTTSPQNKFDELLKSKDLEDEAETEKLTPAMQKSQELEAKHADEKVIAENIKTEAVKDDKSPITNVSVTKKV